jgi:hypothetical protein
MINYTKLFCFATTIFENHVFKIGLYIFIKNQADITTYKIDHMYIRYWIYFILNQWQPKYINEFLEFS